MCLSCALLTPCLLFTSPFAIGWWDGLSFACSREGYFFSNVVSLKLSLHVATVGVLVTLELSIHQKRWTHLILSHWIIPTRFAYLTRCCNVQVSYPLLKLRQYAETQASLLTSLYALLVNALCWPMRRLKRCRLCLCVCSSTSCRADWLCCSSVSHSVTRLPPHHQSFSCEVFGVAFSSTVILLGAWSCPFFMSSNSHNRA